MKTAHTLFQILSRSAIVIPVLSSLLLMASFAPQQMATILPYVVDCSQQNIRMYWKNDSGKVIGGIPALKVMLEQKKQTLAFAMNGGMFHQDYAPVGLYIQDRKQLKAIDTSSGVGNFYLKPNGVFAITVQRKALVVSTERFVNTGNIVFATQSGPMLLTDGQIHRRFKSGSAHLHIRNGVGILPDGKILFAISRIPVSLYDFALYFKNAGCRNALYLDGAISRAYMPHIGWNYSDGKLGVMIGVVQP